MTGEYFGRRFLSHITSLTPFFDTGYMTETLREEEQITPEDSLQLPGVPLKDYLILIAKLEEEITGLSLGRDNSH